MGQAAALTGGYGNSYAQTVGQQTYQGYLQGLNDKVPELYQLALGKYQMEGDELMNKYGLLADQEQRDYGRYRDTVADFQNDLNMLQGIYESERGFDYGKYSDDRNFGYNQYVDDRNYEYQLGRDQISDQQWMDAFLYQQERDKVADEQWLKEFEEAQRQYDQNYAKSSGGGGGGGGYVPPQTPPPQEPPQEPELSDLEKRLIAMKEDGESNRTIRNEILTEFRKREIDVEESRRLNSLYGGVNYAK